MSAYRSRSLRLVDVGLARELRRALDLVAGEDVSDHDIQPVASGRQGPDGHAHQLSPHRAQHGVLARHAEILALPSRGEPALEPDARVAPRRAHAGLVLE